MKMKAAACQGAWGGRREPPHPRRPSTEKRSRRRQGDARQHRKSHLPIFVLAALQGSRVHIHLKGGLERPWGRCVWHHILNDHGQWKCQSPCRRAFPGSGGRSGSAQGPPDSASLLGAASAVWLASRKPAKLGFLRGSTGSIVGPSSWAYC